MDIQVLVSTMHQNDFTILDTMNIQSNAIIINQCEKNEIIKFKRDQNEILFMSFAERGIGLSRNTALMRATAEICVFADDDVRYVKGYKNIILEAFKKNPNADMILFNLPSTNPNRPTHIIKHSHNVKIYNCLRYGAVNIAVRTEKIKQANIYYSLQFGGGAKYSSGEDSLFIYQCIKNGLKVCAEPVTIGYVKQEESTWFNGYNEKYFIDKGVFFASLSKTWSRLLCLQLLIRHSEMWRERFKFSEVYSLMKQGISIANGDI